MRRATSLTRRAAIGGIGVACNDFNPYGVGCIVFSTDVDGDGWQGKRARFLSHQGIAVGDAADRRLMAVDDLHAVAGRFAWAVQYVKSGYLFNDLCAFYVLGVDLVFKAKLLALGYNRRCRSHNADCGTK